MQSNTQEIEQKEESILYEVISEIQSQSSDFTWYISSEKLISILDFKKETYYKFLYSLRNSEFNPSTLRGFHETEGKYLCILLKKLLHLENIEEEFALAGVYFSNEFLHEFQLTFLKVFENTVSSHKLDKDLLILINSATLTFDDAFDSYFDDKFDLDRIITKSILDFYSSYPIDPYYGAEDFLRKFIINQITYKKLKLNKIKNEYKERYYFEIFGRVRERKKKVKPRIKYNKETYELLDFFGLDDTAEKKDLRKKYKELLLRFHPDINKEGLEKTKEINTNYKRLLLILEV